MISGFFSGSFDPTWPHVTLLGIAIVASFAVATGIVLENPKWSLANVLVVGGVAIEAVCTLLLFGFDEGISGKQQETIIALEERLAARKLSDAQVAAIAARLKPYSGQTFQIIPYWKNPESFAIANRLADTLKKADWKIDQPTSYTALVGVVTGIDIEIDAGETSEVREAAKALEDSLNANGLAATFDDTFKREPTSNRIMISVGIK